MRYVLTCLRCGVKLATTEYVDTPQIEAIENHLQITHPETLPAGRRVDYALLLGQVRVSKGD